jgi:hypothetical protein
MRDGARHSVHHHQTTFVTPSQRGLRDQFGRELKIEVGGQHGRKVSAISSNLRLDRLP